MTTAVQISEGIFRIDLGQVNTPSGNFLSYSQVYLIVDNDETAIIDAVPASAAPVVLDAIRGLGYDPANLSHIILTHIHLDHAGGVGYISQLFSGIKVAVHRRGAGHLVKPDMLIEGTRQAYGKHFEVDYGPITPVPKPQVVPVDEGDVIRVGSRELKILYTPGHASHHISIYDSKSEGIFSGDSLGFHLPGNNSVIIVAGFDLEFALDSIDRMRALKPKHIYAAHGSTLREPDEFIDSVRTTTKDYGDIILQSMKAGESEGQISERLAAYQKKNSPRDFRSGIREFADVIPWYVAYFKRKGLA